MAIENKPAEPAKPGQPAPAPGQPAPTPKPAGQPAEQPQAEQPRQAAGRASENPGEGLIGELQARHEARTTVPGAPGVDARLDNRAGAARPPLEDWPAKPQQVDGPDVAHQVEHTRATLDALTGGGDDVKRKGQFSVGAHGLSQDDDLREGRAVQGPDEG